MKKIILITLLCVITMSGYAQRVYKEGSAFIIECKGMPEGSYSKLAKPRTKAETVNGIAGINSAAANKTVAYKFEVQGYNASNASKSDNAINICAAKGGTWRLPTLRELQLIWTMHEGLKKLNGFTTFGVNYWSATDHVIGNVWCVYFNTGFSGSFTGTSYDLNVRCIREIIE